MKKVKRATNKPEFVVEKHSKALKGTGFECCARCPGTSGKVESGKMRCSRVGGKPEFISLVQAARCDGSRPPPYSLGKRGSQNHSKTTIIK